VKNVRYKLQHLGIGEVLDQATYLTRDHFGRLFAVMCVLHLPVALIYNFWMLSLVPFAAGDPTPEQAEAMGREFFNILPLFYLINIGYLFVVSLINSLMIPAIAGFYLGQPTTMGSAMKYSLGRLIPLLIVSFLFMLPCILGTFLCLFPGAIYFVCFGLCLEVVMLEKIGGLNALVRAFRLIRHDWLRMCGLSLVLFVAMWFSSVVVQLIPQIHVQIVATALFSAAMQLWWTAAWVVFYYSCRCGNEFFDLHYLVESIHVEPDAAEEAGGAGAAFR
jgi:hypothetical protein